MSLGAIWHNTVDIAKSEPSRMLTKCPRVELMSVAAVSQPLHQNVRVELSYKINSNTEALSKQQRNWSVVSGLIYKISFYKTS